MAEQQAGSPEAGAAAPKPSGGLAGKLVLGGFVGGAVALECLLAYLLFPSPEEIAKLAQKNLEKKLPTLAAEDAHGHEAEKEPVIEVDLGEYSITVTQPNASSSLRVDFHLFGTVPEPKEKEFTHIFEKNVNRFRDQVLIEVRNSDPADLVDPGLALIKRRILEKSNALFGKLILSSVVFSQFSYFEQ
jgi:flagellar FliL protein